MIIQLFYWIFFIGKYFFRTIKYSFIKSIDFFLEQLVVVTGLDMNVSRDVRTHIRIPKKNARGFYFVWCIHSVVDVTLASKDWTVIQVCLPVIQPQGTSKDCFDGAKNIFSASEHSLNFVEKYLQAS